MLRITARQMDACERHTSQRYFDGLVVTLRTEWPDVFAGQPGFVCRQMAGNGLTLARSFRFELESSLARYVALQCETAPDFHAFPQARAILEEDADEDERLGALLDEIPQETWTAIKRGADARAWFEPKQDGQRMVRIAARVCGTFPEVAARWSDAQAAALFTSALAVGIGRGIATDNGLAAYAAAHALYGPDQLAAADAGAPEDLLIALRLRLLVDTGRLI